MRKLSLVVLDKERHRNGITKMWGEKHYVTSGKSTDFKRFANANLKRRTENNI